MDFQSVLFNNARTTAVGEEPPPFVSDLNIDQIVEALTRGREEYDLTALFLLPLRTSDEVAYRHEVFRDIENGELRRALYAFAEGMRSVRSKLAQSERLHYRRQKEWWFLRAARSYCSSVLALAEAMGTIGPQSRALSGMREFLNHYTASQKFKRLVEETQDLERELSSLGYCLLIKDSSVTVQRYESERDYADEVHRLFERFRQGSAKDYSVEFDEWKEMNHVEAAVLDRIALLFPELFERLAELHDGPAGFISETVRRFDREIQFYLAYREVVSSLEERGLQFCLPTIEETDKELSSVDAFDLALALKLSSDDVGIVTNDFELREPERVIVVSGPNQGGKTTFARSFGQLHFLSALGCPVPGRKARLFLFDRLLTHFEREEEIANLRGKLHDDLERMREVLDQASPRSIVILNEIFNSTTLSDEIFLSRRILGKVFEKDCLCVCVTFIDELASLNDRTVSMVATVDPDNPAERTFKIVRQPADGLAYAIAIARRHRVTYEQLTRRVAK